LRPYLLRIAPFYYMLRKIPACSALLSGYFPDIFRLLYSVRKLRFMPFMGRVKPPAPPCHILSLAPFL